MRKLCFGGSFNPIHYGHLRCAQAISDKMGFCSVMLIPNAVSPFKTDHFANLTGTHRCQMCRLAVENEQIFEVSDIEQHRPGPSYTIDTVLELKHQGWDQVHWLIGADQLNSLPRWHRAEELIEIAEFVVMRRPGFEFEWTALPPAFQKLQNNVVEAPLVDISATQIRARVAAGESIDGLTPPAVVDYIRRHGLYRNAT